MRKSQALFLIPLLVLLLTVLTTERTAAQKKPAKKEQLPSKKEMDNMLKEMQQAMDDMSPEDRAMLDSMGVKLPNAKNVGNLAAFASANANKVQPDVLVPKKDAARIAAMPKIVNDERMRPYFASLQSKISATLDATTIETGNKIVKYIKSNSSNSHAAGNMAIALWIKGQPNLAMFVMAQICSEDATDIDNLTNYCSMLIMRGGQHLAIPILNNLNGKFPKNSTILNNLGQAWFGLGDIGKAEKYLDSAIALFSFHPQANMTKAAIEESRGNDAAATAAIKRAIHDYYSEEKERNLERLNYKLKDNDFVWGRPNATDQLGLSKFTWPAVPKNVTESETLELVWEQFHKDIESAQNELSAQEIQLTAGMGEGYQQRVMADLNASKTGGRTSAVFGQLVPKAEKKLRPYIDYLIEMEVKDPLTEAFDRVNGQVDSLQRIEEEELKALFATAHYNNGEGGQAIPQAFCDKIDAIRTKFLSAANTIIEDASQKYRERAKRRITEMVNYQLYTEFPEKFELSVCLAKKEWLSFLGMWKPKFRDKSKLCEESPKRKPQAYVKLKAFDDVACRYNDTLNLGIMTFINNCSRMKSSLNVKFLEYTRYDDFERAIGDEYMNSTLKVSAEWGFDRLKVEKGPLKLEAKVGAGLELEMDRTGISDVNLTAEAKAGAGHNTYDEGLEKYGSVAGKDVIDTTIEAGVEGRVSLISGKGSVSGTGKLGGITITEW